MALTQTDRGDNSGGANGSTVLTVSLGSFTPTNGNLLTLAIGFGVSDGGAGADTVTISNTGFTVDAWTQKVRRTMNDGGTFSINSYVFSATVTSAAAGVITVTRTNVLRDWCIFVDCQEWAGHNGIGLTTSNDDARVSGSTLSVNFGSAPASTSGLHGSVEDNNSSTTGAVPPTGWTESADSGVASAGNSFDAGYIVGSPAQNNQWTSLQTGAFGKIGSIAEILASGGAASAPVNTLRRVIMGNPTAVHGF